MWRDTYESLSAADRAAPLAAEDLELLATAAYMLGRDDEYVHALERAHRAHLDAGEQLRAVRCAFWIGINLDIRGEHGGATGWLGVPGACSSATAATASSAVSSCSSGCSNTRPPATTSPRSPPGPRPSRSASGSEIRTCSRWPPRTWASC